MISPATAAMPANQASAPMYARVSAFISSAVPVLISWSIARGATSPQMSPPMRPSTALPTSAAANQATVERADASFPDRLNCSGTVVIRDFPPRFSRMIVAGDANARARRRRRWV